MHRRHPPPRLWLMTDERLGESLWTALERLPGGSGVVFRHYSTAAHERRALLDRVLIYCRRRGLVLITTGGGLPVGDGCHNRRGPGLRTFAAHNLREIRRGERAGADLIFLSPVFATRSHPGTAPLGRRRFARLARATHLPVVALGGMDAEKFRRLRGAYGWAAIDAWTR